MWLEGNDTILNLSRADAIELDALGDAFGDRPALFAVKARFGNSTHIITKGPEAFCRGKLAELMEVLPNCAQLP